MEIGLLCPQFVRLSTRARKYDASPRISGTGWPAAGTAHPTRVITPEHDVDARPIFCFRQRNVLQILWFVPQAESGPRGLRVARARGVLCCRQSQGAPPRSDGTAVAEGGVET